jgi:hypothetical protein
LRDPWRAERHWPSSRRTVERDVRTQRDAGVEKSAVVASRGCNLDNQICRRVDDGDWQIESGRHAQGIGDLDVDNEDAAL